MESLRMTKRNDEEPFRIEYLLDMDTGEVSRIAQESQYIELQIQGVTALSRETFDELASATRYVPTRRAEGESPYTSSLEFGRAGARFKLYFDAGRPREASDRLYNCFLIREQAVAFDREDLCLPAIQKEAGRLAEMQVGEK